MAEEKKESLKIELPEGTLEATGSSRFLEQIRAALVPVLTGQQPAVPVLPVTAPLQQTTFAPVGSGRLPNIRDLYAEKRPTSDSQAAALIAYYLSEVAPAGEKAETVDADTIIAYFKLCPRDLPTRKDMILTNAKAEGYVASAGERGKYKLTAIGYNLVVHGLPASPAPTGTRTVAPPSRKNSPTKRKSKRR